MSVLKDISVTIDKGDVVCVIGPSGSGKSTFLRCLNMLEKPNGGKAGMVIYHEYWTIIVKPDKELIDKLKV